MSHSFSGIEMFKALSDTTRLCVMRLMMDQRSEMCVGELVDALQVPQYALSRQLKILESARLLLREKRGRHVYYCLADMGRGLTGSLWALIDHIPDPEGAFDADGKRGGMLRTAAVETDDETGRGSEEEPVKPDEVDSLPSNLL